MIRRCPNGETRTNEVGTHKAQTQGTETSKYLEEKKTIVIPQVVASERGTALNSLYF